MEVLCRYMQRLIEEQYIQPHQAQILPLMIMNFSYMIQQNNVCINTYYRSNCQRHV